MSLNLIISQDKNIQENFSKIALIAIPICQCNKCTEIDEEPRTFECAGCNREMWWCYGASDKFSDYCDTCWTVLNKAFPEKD